MRVESAIDLAAFVSPSEFSELATLHTPSGPVPLAVIPDTFTSVSRPAENSNSSTGPFKAGAADVITQMMQIMTTDPAARMASADCTLEILTGDFAGKYRIRAVSRDGDMTRYNLNRTT